MATAVTVPKVEAHERTGIWSWITTVDHKRIGILYGTTAFAFFMIGGIEALMIRVQLMKPGMHFVIGAEYNGLFTMHATTMIFLAVMPLSAAFFNFMVPLQIGARDVAFPRLNAFSYWTFLFGALLINGWFFQGIWTGNLLGHIPPDGWFGYAPLTENQFSPGLAADYWMLGLQVLGIASLAAGFNFITTIFNMRAPGMTMMRMPVFCWMTLVVQFLVVFSFPMITVGLILLMFDRFFGTTFYLASAGADPLLWQHLFWLFGHPEVYILILPAMGIVSEVLPTFSRKPLFGAPFVIFSGIMIGILGFGVWAHHMFTTGLGPIANSAFAMTTMLIAIPTAVKIFNWIATMWGGHLSLKTPALFSIGFVALFVIGGLSGVMHASPPIDLHHQDSYFVVAHIHYVLFGGAIMGLFSGIYYWWPKVFGKMLDDGLGKLHFWLWFIAMNITFFPMHFLGVDGMPRRIFTYFPADGWSEWNMVASLGAFALGGSLLIFLYNVIKTTISAPKAPADPWDGATLEWATSSPPPEHDFDRVPKVTSSRPYWDEKHETPEPERDSRHWMPADAHIHVPNPTFWPVVTSFGVGMIFGSFLLPEHIRFFVTGGGLLVLLTGMLAWLHEPLE